MDRDELRALQAPLKERYREDPQAALVTLSAEGDLDEGIACSVRTGVSLAVAAAGLATVQALLFLDGRHRPATWSAVLQLRPADGTVVRHGYRPHPGCGCILDAEPAEAG